MVSNILKKRTHIKNMVWDLEKRFKESLRDFILIQWLREREKKKGFREES